MIPSDPSDTLRCFVALRPSTDQLDAIAARMDALRSRRPDDDRALRFVRPEQLHLTLAFLGDLPADRVDALVSAVGAPARTLAPFEVAFGRLGGFPSIDRARVAWLDVSTGREGVVEAAAAVRRALRAAGLPFDDRPFRAHLTVARARRGPVPLPDLGDLDRSTPAAPVGHVEVLRSDLTARGARHHLLARFPFGTGRATTGRAPTGRVSEWDAATAEWYASRYGEYATNRLAVDALDLAPTLTVVDVGCGAGAALRRAAAVVTRGRLIGVDPVPRMLEIARERAASDPAGSRIEFREGAAESLPLEDAVADLVLAFDSFDHWLDPKGGLAEIRRVLRPQGRLVVVKDRGVPGDGAARQAFVMALAETGFEVDDEQEIEGEGVSFAMWTCSTST